MLRNLVCVSWYPLGDSAWLFEPVGQDARERRHEVMRMARSIRAHPLDGMLDLVVSFETLAVHFDPSDGEPILNALQEHPMESDVSSDAKEPAERTIEIPVQYGGPDLESVAKILRRSCDDVVSLHSSALYEVAAIGFSPGFPYLLGLPAELHVPRKHTPSPVRAGSVAVAAGQAGIYPFDSPGGWWALGRTNVRLFDPDRSQPALLQVGDAVRFVPVASLPSRNPTDGLHETSHGPCCEVIDAGGFCMIQDLGRFGFQHAGVSPGGAADPQAAQAANALAGNRPDAAVIECGLRGPALRFDSDRWVAWIGWRNGGSPRLVRAGETLDLTRPSRLLRGYLAIAGGFRTPTQLGSRSTDLRGGFGGHRGRLLAAGDRIPLDESLHPMHSGPWKVDWPRPVPAGKPLLLRTLLGAQAHSFSPEMLDLFHSSTFALSPQGDRMGIRLNGSSISHDQPELRSQPVVAGSIQIPPDGRPIILMNDRQTIGGYPQIATVIHADLAKLARAWPGTPVRFCPVTIDEARLAWRRCNRELALLKTGILFHQAPA